MGARTTTHDVPPEPTPAEALGRAIRAQRKRLGLTQKRLALHAEVGLAFLYELETGKPTVRLDKVLAVLATLGVAVTLSQATPIHRPGTFRNNLPEPKK